MHVSFPEQKLKSSTVFFYVWSTAKIFFSIKFLMIEKKAANHHFLIRAQYQQMSDLI